MRHHAPRTILRTRQNLTSCYLSTALSLQTENIAIQRDNESYPDSSSSLCLLAVSTLPSGSLDLDTLPIDFLLVKPLCISWFPRLRFCRRCRNLEFTMTIKISPCSAERHRRTMKSS